MGEDRTEGRTEGAQYITVGEAAQLLGVHRNTVRNRIKDGRIKAHKVLEGEREIYRIDAKSLEDVRTSAYVRNKVAQRTTGGGDVVQMLVHRIDQLIQDYNQQVGDLREHLGEERGRRIRAEEENQRLREELEAQRRSWWRRFFGLE
jgi:excisionase family DNA binding protein